MAVAGTTVAPRCGKAECEVGKTGLCAEGHTPVESCPFYGKGLAIALDSADEDAGCSDAAADNNTELATISAETQHTRLPSGEALDLAGADEFLRWRPFKLVTIVGDLDSGKTTLICSLYAQFLRGPYAGLCFAGSRTLLGFEKRLHSARVDSGRVRPHTLHTSLAEGLQFFHLALCPTDRQGVRVDLMLSDRAGEAYRDARDRSDAVAELVEVAKADTLVLLLDGARVALPAERSGALQAVRQTLRAFLDGGALGSSSHVQVVTTKLDCIERLAGPQKAETHKQLHNFKQKLRETFGPRLAGLVFFDIAARDPEHTLPQAHGIDALLNSWLQQSRPTVYARNGIADLPLHSEFDRLLQRTPMEFIP